MSVQTPGSAHLAGSLGWPPFLPLFLPAFLVSTPVGAFVDAWFLWSLASLSLLVVFGGGALLMGFASQVGTVFLVRPVFMRNLGLVLLTFLFDHLYPPISLAQP